VPTYNNTYSQHTFYLLTTIPVYNNIHLNQSQLTTLIGTPTTAAERGATTLSIISMPSLPQYYTTILLQYTTQQHATTTQATYYQNTTTIISQYIQFYHTITMAMATATAAATAAATPAILPRPRPRQHSTTRRGDVITTRHVLVPACCISSRQLC
jgi:hypothetical protein